jgi:predicted branched-subunit amino acid permease
MSFRKRPLWLPVVAVSAVASMLAVKFVGSPWHVTLGALAGIAVALVMPPRPITQAEIVAAEKLEEGDL